MYCVGSSREQRYGKGLKFKGVRKEGGKRREETRETGNFAPSWKFLKVGAYGGLPRGLVAQRGCWKDTDERRHQGTERRRR